MDVEGVKKGDVGHSAHTATRASCQEAVMG